ncbi:DinB family protein [Planobispora takensis]|nr:DinB family protein [Planobispora takensis]
MTVDWNHELADQLDLLWRTQLRQRLDGMTVEEYLWEPAPGCWNVRPREQADPARAVGAGDFTIDYESPEPDPPPVTTIAWRLGHVIVGVLGARNAAHFGGPPVDYGSFAYAGTPDEALRQLDDAYDLWIKGVRALGTEGLDRRCGPAEGPYADHSLAALVLHVNREVIHHGAEIALLRDLYRHC